MIQEAAGFLRRMENEFSPDFIQGGFDSVKSTFGPTIFFGLTDELEVGVDCPS